jgi:hypothetical protein
LFLNKADPNAAGALLHVLSNDIIMGTKGDEAKDVAVNPPSVRQKAGRERAGLWRYENVVQTIQTSLPDRWQADSAVPENR